MSPSSSRSWDSMSSSQRLRKPMFRDLIQRTEVSGDKSAPDQAALMMMSQKETRQQATDAVWRRVNRQFFMKDPKAGKDAPVEGNTAARKSGLNAPGPQQQADKAVSKVDSVERDRSRSDEGGFPLPAGLPLAKPGEEVKASELAGVTTKAAASRAVQPHAAVRPPKLAIPDEVSDAATPRMPVGDWKAPVAAKNFVAPVPGLQTAAPAMSQAPVTQTPLMAMPVMPRPVFSGSPDKTAMTAGMIDPRK